MAELFSYYSNIDSIYSAKSIYESFGNIRSKPGFFYFSDDINKRFFYSGNKQIEDWVTKNLDNDALLIVNQFYGYLDVYNFYFKTKKDSIKFKKWFDDITLSTELCIIFKDKILISDLSKLSIKNQEKYFFSIIEKYITGKFFLEILSDTFYNDPCKIIGIRLFLENKDDAVALKLVLE